jgi:hypothetical protein
VWGSISDAVLGAVEGIKKWFDANWPTIQAAFATAWEKIQTGFEWLIDHKPVLIGVLTALSVVLFGPVITAIAPTLVVDDTQEPRFDDETAAMARLTSLAPQDAGVVAEALGRHIMRIVATAGLQR